MIELKQAIEEAANLAYEQGADQVVGRINGSWCIAHWEDVGRQDEMSEPKFLVHGDGVDRRHIEDNEITEDWELPGPTGAQDSSP